MKKILRRIEAFPNSLAPISYQVKKYINNDSSINRSVMNILHRPWVAPLNWGLMLYSRAKPRWFKKFSKMTEMEIPDFYQEYLKSMNGGFIYGMSLYGLTPSIYKSGLLNRSILECLDLTTANNSWYINYNLDQKLFYFGSRHYNNVELVGYFFDGNKILCYRKNGELINSWSNLGDMLLDEIAILEDTMLREVPEGVKLNVA